MRAWLYIINFLFLLSKFTKNHSPQEINISLPFSTSEMPYLQGFQRLAFYKIFKSIIFVAKFFEIAPTLEFIRLCSASITTTSHWTFLTVAHCNIQYLFTSFLYKIKLLKIIYNSIYIILKSRNTSFNPRMSIFIFSKNKY